MVPLVISGYQSITKGLLSEYIKYICVEIIMYRSPKCTPPPLLPSSSKSCICPCKQLHVLHSQPFDILVEITPRIDQRQAMEKWNKSQRDPHCCNHIWSFNQPPSFNPSNSGSYGYHLNATPMVWHCIQTTLWFSALRPPKQQNWPKKWREILHPWHQTT